jgi:hypothetical protein
MPWEIFRKLGGQDWSGSDRIVANLGRTMRLAPTPHYMCWWQIPSIKRMDEWEEYFRSNEGRIYLAESPTGKALHFQRCGLYDEIIGHGEVPSGLHLVEFFAAPGQSAGEIKHWFGERAADSGAGRLTYVVNRLGLIAPDPGGMAIWTFPDYAGAEPFLRHPSPAGPIVVTAAGLYRNFGEDIP